MQYQSELRHSEEKKTSFGFYRVWLLGAMLGVVSIVIIGGITRLTDSGLSIVNWRPIMGVIPPLNVEQWTHAFDAYKQYPEYKLQNLHMTLDDFKKIFFWEYLHRMIGRVLGLWFIFPFVYFLVKKQLSPCRIRRVLGIFLLGGLQGFVGWYMVKSGLSVRPDVSHFRLAMHLLLAFTIFQLIFREFLTTFSRTKVSDITPISSSLKNSVIGAFVVLIVQIIYGAFVAGLKAGYAYNTWPKMGGEWMPPSLFIKSSFIDNCLNNPFMIQFIHRSIGLVLTALVIAIAVQLLCNKTYRHVGFVLLLAIGVQFSLGVMTLVLSVPLVLGVLHQLGALVLLSVFVYFFYFHSTIKQT